MDLQLLRQAHTEELIEITTHKGKYNKYMHANTLHIHINKHVHIYTFFSSLLSFLVYLSCFLYFDLALRPPPPQRPIPFRITGTARPRLPQQQRRFMLHSQKGVTADVGRAAAAGRKTIRWIMRSSKAIMKDWEGLGGREDCGEECGSCSVGDGALCM